MLDATKCQAQCVLCAGTKYSGELRKCTSTDTADGRCGGVVDAHYHCTDWNTTELDEEKRWFCLSCAKVDFDQFILYIIISMHHLLNSNYVLSYQIIVISLRVKILSINLISYLL